MKRSMPVAIALVLTLGLFGPALAAQYFIGYCTEAACYPFNGSNSYVQQKAVTVATSNNAAVGDTIYLISGPTRTCEQVDLEWTVNQVPTLNSTHLTYRGGMCTTRDH